jgi:predicted dienelactone hydrolase
MAYRKLLILAAFVLLVLAALFVRVGGQKAAHPDTPPYGLPGPYPVGTRGLATGGDTLLEMTVWYPASNEGNRRTAATYPYQLKMGAPFGDVALAASKGQAIDNAPYDRSAGPYPLVILSPGFSIGSAAYGWLAEHLTSYGFVVISPDHSENLDPETQLWRAAITRPQDVLAVLAYTDEQTGSGGDFEGLIDTERVAVVGHSYGGYTALAAAGARIDTDSFEAHCERI